LGSLSRTSRIFYFPDYQDLLNVLGGPLGELQHNKKCSILQGELDSSTPRVSGVS
jgi:hypothetical protein